MQTVSHYPRRRQPQVGNVRRYSRYANRILSFFALHRIALATQVQRAMPDILPIDRTARLHLQTLVADGDLVLRRDRAIGGRNVYQLTTRGFERVAAGT